MSIQSLNYRKKRVSYVYSIGVRYASNALWVEEMIKPNLEGKIFWELSFFIGLSLLDSCMSFVRWCASWFVEKRFLVYTYKSRCFLYNLFSLSTLSFLSMPQARSLRNQKLSCFLFLLSSFFPVSTSVTSLLALPPPHSVFIYVLNVD